jgi:hypothetical protein
MRKVHSIGDSHCAFSFRDIEEEYILYFRGEDILKVPFEIHYLGSKTMYSFGKKGVAEENYHGIGLGEYLVFCFGEIDVRCHIYNQIHLHHRKLEEVITSLVDAYISRIKEVEAKYGIFPVIFGVIPPVRELIVEGYPSVGPYQDRVEYTKLLNASLKKAASNDGILYFDVFDEYALKDGSLNMKYSDGIMHISQEYNRPIKNKLCDLILS